MITLFDVSPFWCVIFPIGRALLVKLDTLVARYDELNRLKTQRALDLMSRYGQQVFHLLPVMLHFNHPCCPVYVGMCLMVSGVLSPTRPSRPSSRISARTPTARAVSVPTTSPSRALLHGSTSSIGQCCHSDLDIWVCHVAGLSERAPRPAGTEVPAPLHLGGAAGVDLNFFLIPEDKFRQRNDAQMQGRAAAAPSTCCCSTSSTAAPCIAGKRLLWYLVPAEYDDHYDDYVNGLFAHGKT